MAANPSPGPFTSMVKGLGAAGGGNTPQSALTPVGAPGPFGASVQAGAQQAGPRRVKSDPRFRSYAERYTAARCHLFRTSPEGHMEDQWECVLDARRIYNMIRSVGENIDPEEL